MQRAVLQQATLIDVPAQSMRVVSGQTAGLENQAVNDDSYQGESSSLRLVLSVLANVIGGTVLLTAMFVLPHIIGKILS
jgi:hypothetical protein